MGTSEIAKLLTNRLGLAQIDLVELGPSALLWCDQNVQELKSPV